MARQEFKAGDLVRISMRVARSVSASCIYFGAVQEIKSAGRDWAVIVESGSCLGYTIPFKGLKLAKQAMRKRDQYAGRRG